jgi:hypothetical protein
MLCTINASCERIEFNGTLSAILFGHASRHVANTTIGLTIDTTRHISSPHTDMLTDVVFSPQFYISFHGQQNYSTQ